MPRIVFAFDKQSARSTDADGRMRVKDCILSTAEINPYRGQEIPGFDDLGLKPNSVYDLYRDPEELAKAVASFEGVPLMVKHIPQTAEEPRKEYQCGAVHTVTFDGKHLRGDLLVSDGYAIELIESGELSDLSCGYRYEPDMVSGEFRGQQYDGVMRNIKGNHVALVDDGRASGAHVADSAFRNPNLPDPYLQGADMSFPEQKKQDPAAAPGATPPAAAAPPGAPPAAEPANGQADMAAIGQALKHMAGMMEQMLAKLGGAPAAMDEDLDESDALEGEREAAMDSETGENDEIKQDPDVGEDEMTLEPAIKGESETAMDEGEDQTGEYPMPKQAVQEGTPARGNPTPHGAMDARSVKALVQGAVENERKRAAATEQAKRDVQSVLGPVYGLDSAPEIYREALKQVGVNVAAVAKGTEKVAWQAYSAAITAAHGTRHEPEMAMDAKSAEAMQTRLMGHLSRISVKG